MKKRAVIIHGWEGNPDRGWLPWLKKNLEEKGFDVTVPAMPDSANPKEKKWVETISKIVGKPDKNTFLIGHSLGCIAIVRYLMTLKKGEILGGALFVAGFSGNISTPELAGFYSLEKDVKEGRNHLLKSTMIYSDNDDFVSIEKSEEFKKHLGNTDGIIVKGMGHFSEDEGVFELPQALEEVIRMSV